MAFFVVGRDRNDGALRLLDSSVHDTREDAIRALQVQALSGAVDLDGLDVYVADLDNANLAVVVGLPAAAPVVADEGTAGAWEAPAPAIVHELPVEDPGDLLLASALQKAATHLESQGITAPESVGFEPEGAPEEEPMPAGPAVEPQTEPEPESEPEVPEIADEPSDSEPEPELEVELEPVSEAEDAVPEVAIAEVVEEVFEPLGIAGSEASVEPAPHSVPDDLSAVIASLGALGGEAPIAHEEPALPPTQGWPWLNVDDVDDVDAVVPADEADEEVSPIDTAPQDATPIFSDEDSLIPPVPYAEDFTAQPVIMGDYASDTMTDFDDAPEAPAVSPVVAEPEPTPAIIADLPLVPDPSTAYEPAGDLSLDAYTCADCIYSNTCPKVNQTTPAECGAFQWKAV